MNYMMKMGWRFADTLTFSSPSNAAKSNSLHTEILDGTASFKNHQSKMHQRKSPGSALKESQQPSSLFSSTINIQQEKQGSILCLS